MDKIDSFMGEYRWLSNFHKCSVEFEGSIYPSSENAYMASKTLDKELRKAFLFIEPREAKRLGRQIPLREDWEDIKDIMMYRICWTKFNENSDLWTKLYDTEDAELIEGNTWGDVYWGVCGGVGKNMLGKILMEIRRELRDSV